jgi:hypothetical protein
MEIIFFCVVPILVVWWLWWNVPVWLQRWRRSRAVPTWESAGMSQGLAWTNKETSDEIAMEGMIDGRKLIFKERFDVTRLTRGYWSLPLFYDYTVLSIEMPAGVIKHTIWIMPQGPLTKLFNSALYSYNKTDDPQFDRHLAIRSGDVEFATFAMGDAGVRAGLGEIRSVSAITVADSGSLTCELRGLEQDGERVRHLIQTFIRWADTLAGG